MIPFWEVRDEECVGYRVNSSDSARPCRAYSSGSNDRRAKVLRMIEKELLHRFRGTDRRDRYEVSSDRLSEAGIRTATRIAVSARSQNPNFYGWAALTAGQLRRAGLHVVATPVCEPFNPYHADVKFPHDIEADQVRWGLLLNRLVSAVDWQDQPRSRLRHR